MWRALFPSVAFVFFVVSSAPGLVVAGFVLFRKERNHESYEMDEIVAAVACIVSFRRFRFFRGFQIALPAELFISWYGSSAFLRLMVEIFYQAESYRIMGACFEVYKEKGNGFLELVYQECLELELDLQSIPSVARPRLDVKYKGRPLSRTFEPDFICYDKIIMELKAVSQLADEHRAQVHNYLKATGLRLGLLINFGHPRKLEWERIVR